MNSLVQSGCQNGNLVKIRGYGTSCKGVGSYFALEQAFVIFVMWPSTLVILCNKFR